VADNYRREVLESTVIGPKWVLMTLECGHAIKHRLKSMKNPIPRRKVCDQCQIEDDRRVA
jgi:hypothetical protein